VFHTRLVEGGHQIQQGLEVAVHVSLPAGGQQLVDVRSCVIIYRKRSNPLLQAREVLRLLAEEGIEGSGKRAEPRGDGD